MPRAAASSATPKGALGELLVQLDGMMRHDGLFVVATTNELEAIEPALRDRPSRFDRVIEFGVPEEEVRRAHLQKLLETHDLDPGDLRTIAREADGLSGAQLEELALLARRKALGGEKTEITLQELRVALDRARRFKAQPMGFGDVQESVEDEDWYP